MTGVSIAHVKINIQRYWQRSKDDDVCVFVLCIAMRWEPTIYTFDHIQTYQATDWAKSSFNIVISLYIFVQHREIIRQCLWFGFSLVCCICIYNRFYVYDVCKFWCVLFCDQFKFVAYLQRISMFLTMPSGMAYWPYILTVAATHKIALAQRKWTKRRKKII